MTTHEEQKYIAVLKTIAKLGGNLPDDRLTSKTGPNDAVARGLMYVSARELALAALETDLDEL
jgi:hypothetical protein